MAETTGFNYCTADANWDLDSARPLELIVDREFDGEKCQPRRQGQTMTQEHQQIMLKMNSEYVQRFHWCGSICRYS